MGHSELGAAAATKAIWWDLRLATLLTHLFQLTSDCASQVHRMITYGDNCGGYLHSRYRSVAQITFPID